MNASLTFDDRRELRRHVKALAARMDNQPPIERVTITPFRHLGSYMCATVSLTYSGGHRRRLFFKDLSRPFRSKEEMKARRDRELHVYEDLLVDSGLGTAELFDSYRSTETGRCWLLLEHLEGTVIEDPADELAVEAAAWLAQLQSYFLPRGTELSSDEYLLQHNAAFFNHPLAKAVQQVGQISPRSVETLAKAVDGYEQVVELMAAQPRTLVHGGYIPWHVIVDTSASPVRVSAIDWELAAAGSPLYDIAYFADSTGTAAQDRLFAAYRSAAIRYGVPIPNDADMRSIVNSFKLYRTLDWLTHSVEQAFSEEKVFQLVKRTAHLRQNLRV